MSPDFVHQGIEVLVGEFGIIRRLVNPYHVRWTIAINDKRPEALKFFVVTPYYFKEDMLRTFKSNK